MVSWDGHQYMGIDIFIFWDVKTYHRLTMAHMLIYYGDIGICVDFSNEMGTLY